jgi:small conductance mechanosensitive channel
MITVSDILARVETLALTYGPKVLGAIIVLILGLIIIGVVKRTLRRRLKRSRREVALQHFLVSLVGIGLTVLLLVTVAGMIGIATTSFIALLGAAGLAVGLALQGSLANFAGGVLILFLKPFKIGHVVEAKGVTGVVEKIEIFYTHIRKFDNVLVIIPNGELSNDQITNYSRLERRRADITIGVSYDDDIRKVAKVLNDIIASDKRILKDPEPFVRMTELGDSSVNFSVRIWAEMDDFWPMHHDFMETVKLRFDKEKISFPFPQMAVHVQK